MRRKWISILVLATLLGNLLPFDGIAFAEEDTTPPVIEGHNNETVEADSATGATVLYTVPNATDDVDGIFPATCVPASGSFFVLGSTPVLCNATDTAGNAAIQTTFTIIVQDTAAPSLSEAQAIPTLTNDATPDYTFSSTEAGTINYSGDCTSSTTAATSGNNTITLTPLPDGSYSGCSLTVTDAQSNISAPLSLSAFTIDTVAPSALLSGIPSSVSNVRTVDITVSGTDITQYKYKLDSGAFSSEKSIATHITANGLNDGTHVLSVIGRDAASNWQNEGSATTYTWTIDATGPTLVEILPVTNPSNDATPSYTFSSTEAGSITYGGSCTSPDTAAIVGNTTVTFSALSDGTYSNCSLSVTDGLGNSTTLPITTFTIDTVAPTAMLSGTPALHSNATSATITVAGSEVTHYKYKIDNDSYSAEIAVSSPITLNNLSEGSHTISVVGRDAAGNWQLVVDTTTFAWSIDTTAPILGQITAVPTPATDNTPSYTFISTEAGVITYIGSCISGSAAAVVGMNTIIFNVLPDGTYASCSLTVTDISGNVSQALSISSFTIDTTGPTLTEITPVTTPTNDTTPNYTFSSNETGWITYGGGCSSATNSAVVGSNTITFNALVDGVYSACTVRVIDALGNVSNVLTITSFTIDTIPPVVVLSGLPALHSNQTAMNITVGGTGVTHYMYKLDSGSYSIEKPIATHITDGALADGSHTISVIGRDAAGNWQLSAQATTYTWALETVAPTLAQVTPVATPTNDATPDYTFISTEPGTINYAGVCTSAITAAVIGNNTITFNTLADGTYSACSLTVTDQSGNVSLPLSIASFTVDTGAPTATLSGTPANPTKQIITDITVAGTQVTHYKYKLDAGSYGAETALATHITLSGLTGGSHTLSVIGKDTAGNWQSEATPTTYTWLIDLTAPLLSETTAVVNPTNDATPDYTFTTTEAGTLTYGGSCSSVTTAAVVGANTITLNLLADGTYSNCTLTVTDGVGNVSTALTISPFTVTTLAKVAVLSNIPTNPTRATATDIIVGGTDITHYKYKIDAGLAYSAETPIATHIVETGLTVGSHTVSVIGKDVAGNWQSESHATTYTWTIELVLLEVQPVTSPTNSQNPVYKFSSTKVGTLTYAGGCTSQSTVALAGTNTIAFNTLADGVYSTCTITLTEVPNAQFPSGKKNLPLPVSSFTIDTVAPVAALTNTPQSATNSTTADLTVNATEVVNYKYKLDSGSWSAIKPVTEHILLSGLTTGNHSLAIVGKDAAGNWQADAVATLYTWSIDLVAPLVTGLTNDAVVTNAKTWTWDSNDAAATFRFSIDQSATGVPTGSYSTIKTATKNTGTGTFYLHVQAIDLAGNESSVVTVSAVLDGTPPGTLTLAATPPATTALRNISITVSGADAVAYKYAIDSLTWGIERPIAQPIAETTLAPGLHTLSVIARDSVGNWQQDSAATVFPWRILAAPQGNPVPGVHTAIIPSLTLLSSTATSIRYTTDATVPTCSTGTLFTTGIRVAKTTTFTTVACDAAGIATPASTLVYTMNLAFTDEQLETLAPLGVLEIPSGFTATATPTSTAALGFRVWVNGNPDSTTIEIPEGTSMSSADGTNFDVTTLHSPFVSPFNLSGLGDFVVVDGALQWGVATSSLLFSQPITIRLFVGTDLNGSTLQIRRSPLSYSGWTSEGINTPSTCVVASGFCVFTATKASYYAAYHIATPVVTPPSSGGGGGGGGGSSSGSSSSGGGGGGGAAGPAPATTVPSDGTISINNGADETATSTVTLFLSSLNATKMALSNTSDFKGSFWENYATSTPWKLSYGKGVKTVYVRFRNNDGVAKVVSDTIRLTVDGDPTEASTSGTASSTPTLTDSPQVLGYEYDNVIEKEKSLVTKINYSLVKQVLGLILLQVQDLGRAWYVDPVSSQRYYLADGSMAYTALRTFGLGITNADLAKIPVGTEPRFVMTDTDKDGLPDKLEEALQTNPESVDTDGDGVSDADEVLRAYTNPKGSGRQVFSGLLANALKGRIVLQVESRGEAWYIYPKDGKRYYLANGEAAYQIMRYLSLGIANEHLRMIGVGDITDK